MFDIIFQPRVISVAPSDGGAPRAVGRNPKSYMAGVVRPNCLQALSQSGILAQVVVLVNLTHFRCLVQNRLELSVDSLSQHASIKVDRSQSFPSSFG